MDKEVPRLAQGRKQDQGPGDASEHEEAWVVWREAAMPVDLFKCVVWFCFVSRTELFLSCLLHSYYMSQ